MVLQCFFQSGLVFVFVFQTGSLCLQTTFSTVFQTSSSVFFRLALLVCLFVCLVVFRK